MSYKLDGSYKAKFFVRKKYLDPITDFKFSGYNERLLNGVCPSKAKESI
jgi:hypothetical protein